MYLSTCTCAICASFAVTDARAAGSGGEHPPDHAVDPASGGDAHALFPVGGQAARLRGALVDLGRRPGQQPHLPLGVLPPPQVRYFFHQFFCISLFLSFYLSLYFAARSSDVQTVASGV